MTEKAKNRHNQLVGKWGEDCAVRFLVTKGFGIEGRNIRTPEGEIDLLVKKDGCLVFVEVKTRTNNQKGYPEEAITEEKLEHMHNSAEYYLQQHTENEDNWRIDVISVTGRIKETDPQIEWFEDVS